MMTSVRSLSLDNIRACFVGRSSAGLTRNELSLFSRRRRYLCTAFGFLSTPPLDGGASDPTSAWRRSLSRRRISNSAGSLPVCGPGCQLAWDVVGTGPHARTGCDRSRCPRLGNRLYRHCFLHHCRLDESERRRSALFHQMAVRRFYHRCFMERAAGCDVLSAHFSQAAGHPLAARLFHCANLSGRIGFRGWHTSLPGWPGRSQLCIFPGFSPRSSPAFA